MCEHAHACCNPNKSPNLLHSHISLIIKKKKSSFLFFRCELLRLSPPLFVCLHPDGWDHHASFSCEGEGDALLVIGTFIDKERIKRLFAPVLQHFTWEGLEQGVFRAEQAEVSVLYEAKITWASEVCFSTGVSYESSNGTSDCTAVVVLNNLIYIPEPDLWWLMWQALGSVS